MNIAGKRVMFLCTHGVEEVELVRPWQAVEAAGGEPSLISLEPGEVRAFRHLDPGGSFSVDLTVGQARVDDFDALVLPGGVANPDLLRQDEGAVALVRAFFAAGKPVFAICHAPWLLIEAGAASGRRLTSWPSLRTDLLNAGANWVDEPLVRDRGLVTSRKPDDLDAFCAAIVEPEREVEDASEEGNAAPGKVTEASIESFPASDPPSYTP